MRWQRITVTSFRILVVEPKQFYHFPVRVSRVSILCHVECTQNRETARLNVIRSSSEIFNSVHRNDYSEKSDFAVCSVDHDLVHVIRFTVSYFQRLAPVPFTVHLIPLIDCSKWTNYRQEEKWIPSQLRWFLIINSYSFSLESLSECSIRRCHRIWTADIRNSRYLSKIHEISDDHRVPRIDRNSIKTSS